MEVLILVIDAQTIITAGAVLTALTGFFALGWKLFKWVDHQKEQDQEVARVEQKFDNEISRVEKKFDKEMQQLRTEMAIFDLFHDVYVTNGLFSNASKAKLRKQKYSMWNSIFSMQAERVQAQTQIALQTAMRKHITLLK